MTDRLGRTPSSSSRRTLERRPSTASSSRDVFSDEHAYDDMVVADGFRPAPMTATAHTITPARARPTPFLRQQPQSAARPSEESKPEKRPSMLGAGATIVARNSFSLRHDAGDGPQRRESTRTEMSQRPNSMISTFSIPPAPSPFVGASGPSHPYGMYPQDTSLNRASTAEPAQPSHPYGMYSQTTNADLAGSADIASIGFPGLGRSYARRLGPDGEDADDIIGPDGHTEQLPPYTRYPDGQPRYKEQYAPSVEAASSEDTTAVADSPRERLLDGSESSTVAVTEDGQTPKWAQKGHRRYFGGRVPAWLIWLGLLLLLMVAATIGGVIGRMMRNNGNNNGGGGFPHKQAQGTDGTPDNLPTSIPTAIISVTTTLIDASPLVTPIAGIKQIQTGKFEFQLNSASESSSGCLVDPHQAGSGAWACPNEGNMLWLVQPSDVKATEVTLVGEDARGRLGYGPQPPSMPGPMGLSLVQDMEQRPLGPAFWFQSRFTKQVILPQNALNNSLPSRELSARVRTAYDVRNRIYGRDGHIGDDDQFWACSWNDTIIEGFIYITPGPGPSSAHPSSSSSSSSASSGGSAAASTTPPPLPPPPAAATSSADPSASSHARLLAARWRHHKGKGGKGAKGAKDTAQNEAIPRYPLPIKIVERRSSKGLSNPTCQLMKLNLNDPDPFAMQPVLNKGQPSIITLHEGPAHSQDVEGDQIKSGAKATASAPPPRMKKRADDTCVCEWMP